MKTKILNYTSLLTIAALLSGCAYFKSNWQTIAGKTLSTTALTVDTTMRGWAAYVAIGKASPQQESVVKIAYGKYQTSMSFALQAYSIAVNANNENIWSSAASDLNVQKNSLINITSSLQNTPVINIK